jgi:hypothetical protein
LLRESLINAGYATNNDEADDLIVNALGIPKDYTETNTDWYDVVTQTGDQAQYNFSLTGGNEKTQFYTSAGFFQPEWYNHNFKLQTLQRRLFANAQTQFKTYIHNRFKRQL